MFSVLENWFNDHKVIANVLLALEGAVVGAMFVLIG